MDVERVGQAEIGDRLGEPLEERAGRERLPRQRAVEVVMVAATAPLPERRPAGIGHLHGPAPPRGDRRREEPAEFTGVAPSRCGEHGRIVGGEEIDALVEDRQLREFAVG